MAAVVGLEPAAPDGSARAAVRVKAPARTRCYWSARDFVLADSSYGYVEGLVLLVPERRSAALDHEFLTPTARLCSIFLPRRGGIDVQLHGFTVRRDGFVVDPMLGATIPRLPPHERRAACAGVVHVPIYSFGIPDLQLWGDDLPVTRHFPARMQMTLEVLWHVAKACYGVLMG